MDPALRKAARLLETGDMQARSMAIDQLGRSGQPEAALPLIAFLEHALDSWEERFLIAPAIRALGSLHAKQAEPLLLRALESSLYFVQSDAAETLGELGGNDIVLDRLCNALRNTQRKEVREGIVRGLGSIKSPDTVASLVEVVRNDGDLELREEAIRALGRSELHEALAPLTDYYFVEHSERLRLDIIHALSNITAADSVAFLIDRLEEDDPRIRASAAAALGELGVPVAQPSLRRLLADNVEGVRKAAAKALGLIVFLPRSHRATEHSRRS